MLKPYRQALLLILFWIVCIQVNRIFFSVYHWHKFADVPTGEWLLAFFYSLRVDIATAAVLTALPFIFRYVELKSAKTWPYRVFRIVLGILIVLITFIHAGEMVAYSEWNHKLSTRVFMHLSHPDEVARTANYSMIFRFALISVIELFIYFWLSKKFFKRITAQDKTSTGKTLVLSPIQLFLPLGILFLFLRGTGQIPLTMGSAFYSRHPIANDLSVNPTYYFATSYIQYMHSTTDSYMPANVDMEKALATVHNWFDYPKDSTVKFLDNTRPNIVLVVLEGWSAEAIGCLSVTKGGTPNFDKLASGGYLFSHIYACATTSENGNSSIFGGNPTVPEISISMEPEKHRNLYSINQQLSLWGYHTGYIFSGDLKYGNIGGYLMDHGFDVVKDEGSYPSSLPRGKLNFYDRDLYRFLLDEINENKAPFMQCAFTGSTHAPYDQPKGKGKHFTGQEAEYMNSLVYADECIGEFMAKCRKQPWYKNTLFIFIADHGHGNPVVEDPLKSALARIPLLFYGEPIKKGFRGKVNSKIGSQADLAATLMTQMGGDVSKYPFSKDLMNPKSPEFAFHSVIRGFGWVEPAGNFVYNIDLKQNLDNSFTDPVKLKLAEKNCRYYLAAILNQYNKL